MPLFFNSGSTLKCLQDGVACSHAACVTPSIGHPTGIHRGLHAVPSVQDPLTPSTAREARQSLPPTGVERTPALRIGVCLPGLSCSATLLVTTCRACRQREQGGHGPVGGAHPFNVMHDVDVGSFVEEALRCLCHGWKRPDPPSGCLNGGEGVSLWVKLGSGLVFLPLLFPANGVLVMLAMPNAGKCGHVVLMPPLMYLPVCHPSPLSNERFCCQYAPSGPCGLRPMPPLMVGAANIMQTAHARAGIPY